jgi:hypothetical protein
MLDSPLKLFCRTPQLDEENFPAGRFNDFSGVFDKTAPNSTIKRKGKDQAVQISRHRPREYLNPNPFSQFDKRQAAELEDRFHQINRQVIMEDSEAGEFRKLTRNSQFPDAGQTMNEDEFHNIKSYSIKQRRPITIVPNGCN